MLKGRAQYDLFVAEYLKDLNGTHAAIRAGYSAKTARSKANSLLKVPYISKAISEANAKRLKEVEIDATWVLKQAVEVHNRCMQAVPVMERGPDGTMIPSGEYKFDAAGANAALVTVAKHVNVMAFDNSLRLKTAPGDSIKIEISATDKLKDFLNAQAKSLGDAGGASDD